MLIEYSQPEIVSVSAYGGVEAVDIEVEVDRQRVHTRDICRLFHIDHLFDLKIFQDQFNLLKSGRKRVKADLAGSIRYLGDILPSV